MNIKDILASSGITQHELATLAGIPRDRIAKWVQGKGSPKADDTKKLERFIRLYSGKSSQELKNIVADIEKAKNTHANTVIIADGFQKTVDEVHDADLPADMQPTISNRKEITLLGKNPNQRLKPEDFADAFPGWDGLPMYNTPITATFIETYRDENQNSYRPQYYLHDPRFKDCDFGAIVTGDSMHSEIRHGDYVMCKEIHDKRFIVYGDIYYVVASNGLETCKYVNKDPDDPKNNLLLVPRNEKLDSSPLPKDMLVRLYKVKGILRGY